MSLKEIQDRVAKAAEKAGRSVDEIELIAVSKVQPNARVEAVLQEGHRSFGENRVQEAAEKWPGFRSAYSGVSLHLLGPLQSNKTRQAVELFDVIHSVDRAKIARRLADHAQELGKCPGIFVQVNTGDETQKAGVSLENVDAFVSECHSLDLPVRGLMCIPPVDEEPALHFALLAKLADRNGLEGLSMGMSSDFESAIALGATHIRVGSAIFGARVPQG